MLVVPGPLLLAVFRRCDVAYPSHEELASAMIGGDHPTWLVLQQSLKVFDPERSLTAQLEAEAERRYFWCTWGLAALIGVQPLVAVVLAIGVWS